MATLDGGREIVSFCRKDGTFTVYGLPPGVHMLDVVALGWHFPQVKLDVSSRGSGRIRAYYDARRAVVLWEVGIVSFMHYRPFDYLFVE